jgi:hypothetical protein
MKPIRRSDRSPARRWGQLPEGSARLHPPARATRESENREGCRPMITPLWFGQ